MFKTVTTVLLATATLGAAAKEVGETTEWAI